MHKRFAAKGSPWKSLVPPRPSPGTGRLQLRSAYKTDLCQQSKQWQNRGQSIRRSESSRGMPASPEERPCASSTWRERGMPGTGRRKLSRKLLPPKARSSKRCGESSWTRCPSTSPYNGDSARQHRGTNRTPRQRADIHERRAASPCAERPFDKRCLDSKRDRHRGEDRAPLQRQRQAKSERRRLPKCGEKPDDAVRMRQSWRSVLRQIPGRGSAVVTLLPETL